jgi:hypothetical protein
MGLDFFGGGVIPSEEAVSSIASFHMLNLVLSKTSLFFTDNFGYHRYQTAKIIITGEKGCE